MTPTYDELYEKLFRLQQLMMRQRRQGHQDAAGDTSKGQGRVLTLLSLQPEISTKDLFYLLGIRQQSLNELLGKLETAGLVERKPSESDRRVMMVRLTEQGRERQQAAQARQDQLHEIFSCLEDEEQENLADYLDRIADELEQQLPPEEDPPADWVAAARARMGDEKFERLMAMRRGFGHGRGGHHHHFSGGGRGLRHLFDAPAKAAETPEQNDET